MATVRLIAVHRVTVLSGLPVVPVADRLNRHKAPALMCGALVAAKWLSGLAYMDLGVEPVI